MAGNDNDAIEGDVPELIPNERRPLLGEVSARSALAAGYETAPVSPPVKTLDGENPKGLAKLQSLVSDVTGDHWGQVKASIETKEVFIRHAFDEELSVDDGDAPEPPAKWSDRVRACWNQLKGSVGRESSEKWSDLVINFQDEFTLRECFRFFVIFLAIGVLGFSYVFEEWSLLDSLYFTTVLLTTVGYGDIDPMSVGGKLFTSAFAMVGVVVFGLILGVLGSELVEAEMEDFEEVRTKASRAMESAFTRRRKRHPKEKAQSEHCTETGERSLYFVQTGKAPLPRTDSESSLESASSSSTCSSREDPLAQDLGVPAGGTKQKENKHPALSVVRSQLPGLVPILTVGVAIMAKFEKWGWVDSIYYCVITATTIGFGDITPITPLGKGFAILFIPVTVGAMGYILGNVAAAILERRQRKSIETLWSKSNKFTMEDIEALDEAGDGGVSELEYVKYMLVAMQKVDAALIDELQKQFKKLDPLGDGKITKKDLQVIAARRTKKVKRKLELYNYKQKLLKKGKTGKKGTSVFVTATQKLMSFGSET